MAAVKVTLLTFTAACIAAWVSCCQLIILASSKPATLLQSSTEGTDGRTWFFKNLKPDYTTLFSIHRVTESMVTKLSPFCGYNMTQCAELMGDELLCTCPLAAS